MRNSGQRIAPLPIICSLPMLAGRQEIITHRHYLSHLFLPADLTACETTHTENSICNPLTGCLANRQASHIRTRYGESPILLEKTRGAKKKTQRQMCRCTVFPHAWKRALLFNNSTTNLPNHT